MVRARRAIPRPVASDGGAELDAARTRTVPGAVKARKDVPLHRGGSHYQVLTWQVSPGPYRVGLTPVRPELATVRVRGIFMPAEALGWFEPAP